MKEIYSRYNTCVQIIEDRFDGGNGVMITEERDGYRVGVYVEDLRRPSPTKKSVQWKTQEKLFERGDVFGRRIGKVAAVLSCTDRRGPRGWIPQLHYPFPSYRVHFFSFVPDQIHTSRIYILNIETREFVIQWTRERTASDIIKFFNIRWKWCSFNENFNIYIFFW